MKAFYQNLKTTHVILFYFNLATILVKYTLIENKKKVRTAIYYSCNFMYSRIVFQPYINELLTQI